MKLKNLIILFPSLALAASCSGFLEVDESAYQSKDYQFVVFANTKKVCTDVYGYLQSYLTDLYGPMREAATDNAVYAWESSDIKTFYDGSWGANNTIDDQWSHYYRGIAAANYFLENCPEDYPESVYMKDYKDNMVQLKNFPNEVKTLRALFHFELLKRYNSIPIADRSLSLEEVNSLSPVPYAEAVKWITGQLDEVIPLLPDSYADTRDVEIGRVTKRAARAIKARVLLYHASPLNNSSSDRKLYVKAAAAAKDIIDSGTYQLVAEDVVNNPEAKGLIFGLRELPSSIFESYNYPMGYEGGASGNCPSQNLFEAFDMLDGTPFSWDNPSHRAVASEFSVRDPRLGKTLMANGSAFREVSLETFKGGRHGLPKEGATPTSYYLKKFVRTETSFVVGNSNSYQHIIPLYRYAEVLLNYAEALFEASGDKDFKGSLEGVNFTLSAFEAVNMVRERAGVGLLPSSLDAESFRTRLRNERRVELAFEDHRFWDIRRWKIGETTGTVFGLSITKESDETLTYDKVVVQNRVWDERMNFYPISDTEKFKNNNLNQNQGW